MGKFLPNSLYAISNRKRERGLLLLLRNAACSYGLLFMILHSKLEKCESQRIKHTI